MPTPLHPERSVSTRALSRRAFLQTGIAVAGLATLEQAPSALAAPPATGAFANPEYHFLNRISWSVRSTDLARVKARGIPAYLEEQLSPRFVAAGERVAVPPVLRMARQTIYRAYKNNPSGAAYQGLVSGMITRARNSPAQLYERVVEFWSDHFNIASAGLEPEVVDWQRTVIRKYAFTKFRTLLQATAKHVAMLYYLDNAYSNKDHPNENYARELMELHTLGVGSGYTEDDVKAVARIFTGWTADYGDHTGFIFDPDLHDTSDKTVFTNKLIAGTAGPNGVQEGVQLLDLLASDPRTHRFVLRKLCTRFISDSFANPGQPQLDFIETLAGVWQQTDGDIRAILRALFLSDSFRQAPLQKLRRPLDFFVASLRATGTVYKYFNDLEYQTQLLDQVPYGWGPPNGFPDAAPAWANTSGLLARWAAAQSLTSDALPGNGGTLLTHFQVPLRRCKTVGALVDALAQQFFAIALDAESRSALIAFATDSAGTAETLVTPDLLANKLGPLAGLVLSLPNFQWR